MKNTWMFALILFFLFAYPISASAESPDPITDRVIEQSELLETKNFNFPETIKQILSGDLEVSLSGTLEALSRLMFRDIKDNLALIVKMVVLSVLAGILAGLSQSLPRTGGVSEISFLACFVAVAGLSVSVVARMVNLAVNTIDSLFIFMNSLLPIIGSLMASGYSSSLAGFYPTLFYSMQTFTFLCKSFFLPLIMIITVLSVVNAMSGRFHITRLVDLSRRLVKWGIGLLLTVYVGVLGARGLTASVMQGVTGRTVRYALGNFVPLVGGVLAESAEAVLTGLRVIKGAVGLAGVLAVLTLCATPLVKVLTVSVLYRFAAGVTEPATDKRIVKLLVELADNTTQIFSILLMVCVMFIISIALLCSLIV